MTKQQKEQAVPYLGNWDFTERQAEWEQVILQAEIKTKLPETLLLIERSPEG